MPLKKRNGNERPLESLAYKCSLRGNLYFPLIDCILADDPEFSWVIHHELMHRSCLGILGIRMQMRAILAILFELLLDIRLQFQSGGRYETQIQTFKSLID